MNRRAIFTVCGTALAGALAGCNSSDASTPTPTETDSTTPSATATPEPTATPAPTDPEVTAALAAARPKAATAFEQLQTLHVIEDGEIGIESDDGFREFADHNKDDVYDPLTSVRDTLVPVREQGSKTQRARVELLLSLGEYTNTKYQEYTALAEGFSRLYRGIDAYVSNELTKAYDFFTAMREDLATISQRRVEASQLLQRFATDDIDAGIRAFSIMDEQAEQTYVSTLVYRWEPAVRGLTHHIDGVSALAKARNAFETGEYARTVQLARVARETFKTAEEALKTAFDRDVSVFSSRLDIVACRSRGFMQSAETLRSAGESGRNGDEQLAQRTYESADSQFMQAFSDCTGS